MFAPYSKSETRYPSNPCEPQALSSASSNTPIATTAETELTSETGTCSETMQHATRPECTRANADRS